MTIAYFDEGYGVRAVSDGRAGDVFIDVTDAHRNWYGDTHGACFMTLAAASGQRAAGIDRMGINYTFNFMRSAPLHSTLHASSPVPHSGRTMTTVETSVAYQGQVACRTMADYCSAEKFREALEKGKLSDVTLCERIAKRPEAQMELYRASLNAAELDVGGLIFGSRVKKEIAVLGTLERFSVGMPTNDAFMDRIGFIDVGAYCDLGDVTLGIAAQSFAGESPTTQFSLYRVRPAKPGSFLTCEASVQSIVGQFVTVTGTIWADDDVSALMSGVYYALR